MTYYCPLCKQEVSEVLYEKITGVWEEKEKRLAGLKAKEEQLRLREKRMQIRFEAEKKEIAQKEQQKLLAQKRAFEIVLEREKDSLKKKKNALESFFEKKLAKETNQILRQERAKQRLFEKTLREKIEVNAQRSIDKEMKKLQRRDRVQMDKYQKLNNQYISLQKRSDGDLTKAKKKIESLEEQIRKNQTPQVLGLLEEKTFLDKLTQEFPADRFEHTGKGGDIVHHIIDKNTEVGIIVYELKKVATFQKAHIGQTFEAKNKRNADYGILVTNAKRSKDDIGFSVTKGVIIIHPAGALALINIIRDQIIKISRLKLSAEKRNQAVKAVLEYVQGQSFRNGIESIIEATKDLYLSLTKEVNEHTKTWVLRLNKYRDMNSCAYAIETRVVNLLVEERGKTRLPKGEIVPILLPAKID